MRELDRPPQPGTVREFNFPHVRRGRLDNGIQILSARTTELPLVTVEFVVDAGADTDSPGRAGLAHLTSNALEAGAGDRSADEVARDLESLGVSITTSAGWDAAAVRMTVATERLESALPLFADLVRRPVFPDDEVARLRDEQLARIQQRRKEPGALAGEMAARFIFAEDVPYGRPRIGLPESVGAFDRDAVAQFHEERYRPADAALILTGDLDDGTADELVGAHFGDWEGAAAPPAEFTVAPRTEKRAVHAVHRPGAVQSEIRIGHVGVARRNADYFPLRVMNTLLGGAFTSRLNMNLREKHGFTYGVRSGFAFRRRPGPFIVRTAVETDVTVRAIEETLHEIEKLRADGPSEDEVDSARDYLRGVMPLQLQTTDQIAARLADLVVHSLPDDYFDGYRDRIRDVSLDDAHRVAREHIRPEQLAIVVVGDADAVVPQLEKADDLGPVQAHDTPTVPAGAPEP